MTRTPQPAPVGSGAGLARAAALAASIDVGIYRRLRDESCLETPAGRHFADLYNTHTSELSDIVRANPQALEAAARFVESWQPAFLALVDGHGDSEAVSAARLADLQNAIDVFESVGSPELRLALERQEALLNLPAYAGLSATAARARLEGVAPPGAVLPVATSVHGAGGSFFHSDVRVLNPSDSAPVTVTARYRCGAASCGASEQTFTLAPGRAPGLRRHRRRPLRRAGDLRRDRIHAATCSSTAASTRLPGRARPTECTRPARRWTRRTPRPSSSPSPTRRARRPGFGPTSASTTATTCRSRSPSTSSTRPGRRSDGWCGRFPPGSPSRSTTCSAPPGVARDVASAYAVVRADGVHELFAYAAVVDNQTQDPFLIRGRNNRAFEAGATLPAVASVHGVGGSFFHSDVHVLNPDPTEPVTVHARYRCAGGSCGAAEQTFILAPREMRTFDDIAAGLFAAPESFGAVEFEGGVLVDSRLYTPSRPGPTTGMAIPGVRRQRADPESYLPYLSHSTDLARGFRTNVGVYNVNDVIALRDDHAVRRPWWPARGRGPKRPGARADPGQRRLRRGRHRHRRRERLRRRRGPTVCTTFWLTPPSWTTRHRTRRSPWVADASAFPPDRRRSSRRDR